MSSIVVSPLFTLKRERRKAIVRTLACTLVVFGATASAAATPSESVEGCSPQAQTEALSILKNASELTDRYKFQEARHQMASVGILSNAACPIRGWVLAETAMLEIREGHTAQAIAAAETVNNLPGLTQILTPKRIGLNYFVLGTGYAAEQQYEKADRAYHNSLKLTPLDSEEGYARAARIYSDLCFIYMQSGRLREAEESMRRSVDLGQRANNKTEYVLRMDTLAHLHLEQGRLSDAARESRTQLEKFGSDPDISLNVRAHLYRDYGEICYQLNKLPESADSLQKCIDLEDETSGTPDSGLTLVTLAQVHTSQRRYDIAESLLRKAEIRMQPFAADYPANAAAVAVAAGDCWQARGRWTEARAAYARAMDTIRPIGSPSALLQRSLVGAATAAHHLGNKKEEKELKNRMKALLASVSAKPQASSNVVDVLSLRGGNSSF